MKGKKAGIIKISVKMELGQYKKLRYIARMEKKTARQAVETALQNYIDLKTFNARIDHA